MTVASCDHGGGLTMNGKRRGVTRGLTALAMVGIAAVLGSSAVQAGVVTMSFTKGGATTASDLHVTTSSAITAVTVVDGNGNVVANPGPFAAPPAGIGTTNLTFSGGVPGTVAPGGTAPTQPGAGVNRYSFDTGAAGGVKIQKWWWTDPNGL